ncbi:transposase-like protein [Arthrobacter sp. UYEF20]
MSETMDPMATEMDQQELAQQLLAQAREQGIELVGPGGLLNRLTKNVLETALEAEMDEHLGYGKHDVSGRGSGNSRNGTRTKTVMTEIGPVEIDVPRDTGSTFDPQIVKKRQRRLTGVDEIVLSLSAKGLTTGEIAAHFGEVFGARVSKDTISRITEKVIAEMTEWQNRPLDRGRFLVNVANPRERDSHAQIRVEQDAAVGETPLLRTDPSGVLGALTTALRYPTDSPLVNP